MSIDNAEVSLPPYVVYDTCLDVLEAIRVPEHFDDRGSSKTVTGHGHLVDVETVLPIRPVYTIQAPG